MIFNWSSYHWCWWSSMMLMMLMNRKASEWSERYLAASFEINQWHSTDTRMTWIKGRAYVLVRKIHFWSNIHFDILYWAMKISLKSWNSIWVLTHPSLYQLWSVGIYGFKGKRWQWFAVFDWFQLWLGRREAGGWSDVDSSLVLDHSFGPCDDEEEGHDDNIIKWRFWWQWWIWWSIM